MEKYGVDTNKKRRNDKNKDTKLAEEENVCPKCYAKLEADSGVTLCPNCGSEPFEG